MSNFPYFSEKETGLKRTVFENLLLTLFRTASERALGKESVNDDDEDVALGVQYAALSLSRGASNWPHCQLSAEEIYLLQLEGVPPALQAAQALAIGYAACFYDKAQAGQLLWYGAQLLLDSPTPRGTVEEMAEDISSLVKPVAKKYDRYVLGDDSLETFLSGLQLCGDLLAGTPLYLLRDRLMLERQVTLEDWEKKSRVESQASPRFLGQLYLQSFETADLRSGLFRQFLHLFVRDKEDFTDQQIALFVYAYCQTLERLMELAAAGRMEAT